MKKLILMAAFAGLLGSTVVANTLGDDKDKKAKKECCKKGEGKACAGEKKEACAAGEKKAKLLKLNQQKRKNNFVIIYTTLNPFLLKRKGFFV